MSPMSETILTEKEGIVGTPDEQRMEMAILASAVSDRLFLVRAMDEGFDVSLFRTPSARLIASLLTDMRDEAVQATDLLVVRSKLEERGQLSPQVLQYLDALSRTLPPPSERVLSYFDFLRERAGRELMATLAKDMEEFSQSRDGKRASVFDFSERCIQRLMKLQQSRAKKRLLPLNESVREVMSAPKIATKQAKPLLGYSLAPFVRLEHALAGLRRGFYYGLAGAPRRGKTNFALHLASQLGSNHGIPVLFYSWEQTRRVLSARLLAKESGVNPTEMLTGGWEDNPGANDRLAKGLAMIQKYGRSMFVLEGSRQDTVERIRAMAYNVMHDFRTDAVAIFLDYLQKVPLQTPVADPRTRVDDISTGLADLSLELNCPVFVISAIDKEGCRLDDEPGKADLEELLDRPRPTMHHCTGGGDIEYDLDVALVLSKDWAGTQQLAETMQSRSRDLQGPVPQVDLLNLHIDKNRDAPQEVSQAIQYAFFVYENRFVEIDFRRDEERQANFRGFARAQEIFEFLVSHGYLRVPASRQSHDKEIHALSEPATRDL
jgi:replicative DNA helicase